MLHLENRELEWFNNKADDNGEDLIVFRSQVLYVKQMLPQKNISALPDYCASLFSCIFSPRLEQFG
jgi:hypothetical protein